MALAERGHGTAPRRAAGDDAGLAPHRPLATGASLPEAVLRLAYFDTPESDFAWSLGRFAEVHFAAEPPKGGGALLLDIDAFRAPPALPGQGVLVYLNGLRVRSVFVTERTSLRVPLWPGMLRWQDNILTFDLPDAARPADFGMEDERMLGVKLFSLMLEARA